MYAKYALLRTAPKHPEDWAKDMFGGSNQAVNGHGTRSISATVKKASKSWFEVTIVVRADPATSEGVYLFLHNTFPSSTNRLSFDASGAATLKLDCFGAFTVGALMDGGETELEIDLADAPGANALFRSR
jgi:hypothetical protein